MAGMMMFQFWILDCTRQKEIAYALFVSTGLGIASFSCSEVKTCMKCQAIAIFMVEKLHV